MKIRRFVPVVILALCAALSGCAPRPQPGADPAPPQASQSAPRPGRPPEPPAASNAAPDGVSSGIPDGSGEEQGALATLYVGDRDRGFEEYSINYDGELTPELLIQSLADLTGWDLTLAEEVFTGKGGMSVCLSSQSALFTGPPDPQKEAFFVYDAYQLSRTILDSIQKTLQMGFTGPLGDPDALDIYFYMEGEQPLELPELGLSWPLDQPYVWPES